MNTEQCIIINKTKIRKGLFDVEVQSTEIAPYCKAGQFLHIKCGSGVLLRRPISICEASERKIRFVFDVRGEGTYWLSNVDKGQSLDILGPLGKGFTDINYGKNVIFIGGGIGIFPLLMHAKKYGKRATVLLGFKDEKAIVFKNEFEKYGCRVSISTDDGSYGHRGFVTDMLKLCITDEIYDAVFACGPKIMLKKTAQICNDAGIFCEVSMEERMGCGIGACLVCACKTVREDGFMTYSHVCKDGPVFNANEVVFDD